MSLLPYLQFAEELAAAARAVSLSHFRAPLAVETKEDESPVTKADKQTEQALRQAIHDKFPAHGIIGEEFGAEQSAASFVWILDPIDGTRSFISGSRQYCTLIGLAVDGVPALGVLDQPALDERWCGVCFQDERRATFNGQPCRVAAEVALSAAVMATTTIVGADDNAEEQRLRRLAAQVGQMRVGGDAMAFGGVAAGFSHLAADRLMQLYDYWALVPVVRAAGGVMTDWQGAPLTIESGMTETLASAGEALHQAALQALN